VKVTVYRTGWCPYCDAAKSLLEARGIPFSEVNLDDDPGFRQRLFALTGRSTVPQIEIDGEFIGGFTELRVLDRTGGLTAATATATATAT
jgi:glutaredoxin 3